MVLQEECRWESEHSIGLLCPLSEGLCGTDGTFSQFYCVFFHPLFLTFRIAMLIAWNILNCCSSAKYLMASLYLFVFVFPSAIDVVIKIDLYCSGKSAFVEHTIIRVILQNGWHNFKKWTRFTFTFMHLADAFIQSDLQLHSVYTFSLVCVFPGNRTHNLLRCWRNALPLNHTGTQVEVNVSFFHNYRQMQSINIVIWCQYI